MSNRDIALAAHYYLNATEKNNGLALLAYNRLTVKIAKATNTRLVEVQARVIAKAAQA